jgi:hypothetical protein
MKKHICAVLALGLAFSASSHAAAVFKYSCDPHFMNDSALNDTLQITVSATSLKLKDPQTGWNASVAFQAPASDNKLQYQGLEPLNNEPFFAQYLIDKTMLTGAASGSMKAQATGSSFVRGTYRCTRL